MSNFVNCPHCQQQLHETAPACPKCGAPNNTAAAGAYNSYDQVPWYRKRWIVILSAVIFMPITLLIAFTGDIYFEKDGQLQTVPKQSKYVLLGIFLILVAIRTMS
ncbi:hypothetical protein G5S34_04315 [Herbaspirillum frisingense]|uniref:hypothetical protein n=1 Tax=Herbaspirillum frisingense TaxID=92645 RepID=UPI0016025953|nr:hypothetical protein [Herbaspirillum frisingense]QNB06075.1 hypothetical protein G5S34_04315 [Herbaspirillum frisingense]